MYTYTQFDKDFITQRNAQFRQQVGRRIDGSLSEDEFKPLRLMNGLSPATACLYVTGGDSLWHAEFRENAPIGVYCREI